MRNAEEVAAVALLLDPLRWRLYQYIRTSGAAVGRDEAAQEAAVSRNLAAFHLDRMAEAGLLTVEYRRLSGRSGRGAGRPAKLYRAASRHLEISLPATRYTLAARILASALEEKAADEAPEAAARRVGGRVGRELGYEPVSNPDRIDLRNCPFDELAATHRPLVCAMNHALLDGLLAALGAEGLVAEGPRPSPVNCCVRIAAARR